MGKYKKGILGHFRGIIGTVVGSVWNGIKYMKSLPDFGEHNPTPAQLNVQAKFSLVGKFLKRIKALINIGYQQFNRGVTPMNAAMGYHLKNAVTGINAANYALDYSKVRLSVGDLPAAGSPVIAITAAAKLDYSWVDETPPADATGGTDEATFLVYNPDKDKLVTAVGPAIRSAEAYVLQLPLDFGGDNVHAWIYFVSADGKQVSDSSYIGEFLVL